MASAKIRDIEKCKEEVLGICSKYQLNVLDVTSKEVQLDDLNKQYVIDISTDCEDDDIYDKVYTRCGFVNEERLPDADLTVNLNEVNILK